MDQQAAIFGAVDRLLSQWLKRAGWAHPLTRSMAGSICPGQYSAHLGGQVYLAGLILDRVICFGLMRILRFAQPEHKAGLSEPLLDGKGLIALVLSEPSVGSDARAVTTKVVPLHKRPVDQSQPANPSDQNQRNDGLIVYDYEDPIEE